MASITHTLNRAQAFAETVGQALSWLSPLVARVGIGWVFVQSGWGKLHNLEQVTGFFTDLGIPAPGAHALFVSSIELVCGGLILAGLLTRFAAVPLMITMVVALLTALRDQIDSLGSLFGLAECLYIVVCMWLATHGPGPVSLDWLLGRAERGLGGYGALHKNPGSYVTPLSVIPAQAGTQSIQLGRVRPRTNPRTQSSTFRGDGWIPACAGMTSWERFRGFCAKPGYGVKGLRSERMNPNPLTP